MVRGRLFMVSAVSVAPDRGDPAKVGHACYRHVSCAWESETVPEASHAHHEARSRSDDREGEGVGPSLEGNHDDCGADQGWDRVEPAAQDGGYLAHKDVAHHPPADAGDGTENHAVDGAEAMG